MTESSSVSDFMGDREKTKRLSVQESDWRNDPNLKDQLLCELELQHTISAAQIQTLQNIQQELEESRNNFATLYQQAPIGFVTLNHRGHVEEANMVAERLLGLPPESCTISRSRSLSAARMFPVFFRTSRAASGPMNRGP